MAVISTGFSSAISGLDASKKALEVTAHNLSNVDTIGFSRQRVDQRDSHYSNIGGLGFNEFKVGTGVSITQITQIRDIFLDMTYRDESSRLKFYEAKMYGVNELEAIIGEKVGGVSFSSILGSIWESLNELEKHPDGIEARGSFVQNAALFADQANEIAKKFDEYQLDLNNKAYNLVEEVNSLTSQISELNKVIAQAEASGAHANDYRDQRNLHLDRLSEIIDIKYREEPNGMVTVSAEGHQVVVGASHVEMDTVITSPDEPFHQPIWKNTQKKVFNDREISTKKDNDKGELKGTLLLRGNKIVDHTYLTDPVKYEEIEDSVLLKTMAEFDYLVHSVTEKFNEILAPSAGDGPYGLDGSQGIPLFLKIDNTNPRAAGNIVVNKEVLNDVAKLCLSKDKDDLNDNSVVLEILEAWDNEDLKIDPDAKFEMGINEYYESLVNGLASIGKQSENQFVNQNTLVNQINGQRLSIMGVSSDEELTNMIKYQQAYNANAKVISVMDEMIESLINNLV